MNKKLIWGIVIIVAVIILGYFTFIHKITGGLDYGRTGPMDRPIVDEVKTDNNLVASDWKTYKDDQYGFEIKYPSYLAGTPNPDYYKTKIIQFSLPTSSQEKIDELRRTIGKNITSSIITVWVFPDGKCWDPQGQKSGSKNINGTIFDVYIGGGTADLNEDSYSIDQLYQVIRNNICYRIITNHNYSLKAGDDSVTQGILDKAVMSFKFTN